MFPDKERGREMNVRFGILGTGVVGKKLAARLDGIGHDVTVGTRDPEETKSRAEPDAYGNPPFSAWQEEHPEVKLATFSEAATHGEMVVNATSGVVSLEALELAGEDNLNGKVLVDISNPLDFSQGMPPTLSVSNTDSLGEQIQRRFPEAKVVKTLHTMNAYLMVDPAQLAEADHTVFVRQRHRCKGQGGRVAPELQLDRHHRPWRHHDCAWYRDGAPDMVAAVRCAPEARLQL
jgi:8-hydroxy-5-deazaflavin:NADPH oxidoreductase